MFDNYGPQTLISVVLVVFVGATFIKPYCVFVIIFLVPTLLAIYYLIFGTVPERLEPLREHVSAHFKFSERWMTSDTSSDIMLTSNSPHKQAKLPNIRSLKLTPKKHTNENKMRMSSPLPSSPRYLPRGRSPAAMNPGLFGVPKVSGLLKPLHSPRDNPLRNNSILGDVQNQSVLGSDLSISTTSPASSKHSSPLPRVLRHFDSYSHNSECEDFPQTQMTSPRHHPTHQTRYEGVGIMPMVRLNQKPQLNSSLNNNISSSVTIKVAPPDVLKPPPPVFLTQSTTPKEGLKNSMSDSFISAIREKRKRALREEEEAVSPVAPSPQDNKRRRMSGDGIDDEVPETDAELIALAQKRRAPDDSPEESDDAGSKRTRRVSSSSQATSMLSSSSGVRNLIDASFSSSRRWLEKHRKASRSSSKCGEDRSRSLERQSSGTRSRSSSQHEPVERRRQLDSDLMCSATSTPLASCSGRSTPASLSQDELSDSPSSVSKRRPLLLKKGLMKRRLAPLHSDVAESFSRVPQLRYTLTTEEIEQDRQAEKERILRTLEEVEEELSNEKKEKLGRTQEEKKSLVPAATVPAATVSATVSAAAPFPLVAAVATVASPTTTAPSSASNPLMVAPTFSAKSSLPSSSTSSLITFSAKPTAVATPIATTTASANPLLTKQSLHLPSTVAASSLLSTPSLSSAAPSALLTSAVMSIPVNSFGMPESAIKASAAPVSAGFQLPGVPAATTSQFSFGASSQSNGELPRVATAPGSLTFGASVSSSSATPAAKAPFAFGNSSSSTLQQAPTTSSFAFGSKPATTTASANLQPQFGSNTASTASGLQGFLGAVSNGITATPTASLTFGQSSEKSKVAAPSPFQMGQSTTKKPETTAPAFQFGQAPSKPKKAQAPFTFGQASSKAGAAAMFGASGAKSTSANPTAPPAFGASTNNAQFGTAPAFGSAAPFSTPSTQTANAFGVSSTSVSSASSTPFGTAAPKPSTTPFGFSTDASIGAPNVNPFGSAAPAKALTTAPSPFGATSTPAFGSSSSSSSSSTPFGQPSAATNPFGVASSNSASSFGSAPQPNNNAFGNNATQAPNLNFGPAKPAEGGFKFGEANAAPSSFNFGSTPGMSRTASAPSFGETANPASNNSFSIGATSAARRPVAKPMRRRTTRK